MRWISAPPMTARTRSRSCCRRPFPIFWPTAPAASRSAWRRPSRRTIWANFARRSIALIENPDCQDAALLKFVKGPDFPTGGIVVEDQAAIAEAYKTGRGGFRAARALGKRRRRARRLSDRRHRNPLSGAEGQADRAHRRIAGAEEAAAAGRCSRRMRRRHPHRARRPRAARSMPELLMEQLFRPTDLEVAHSAQYECAGQGPGAQA